MRAHFIAVGGAIMHNLALALHKKGYAVTGSDDEIFEPSKSRLAAAGILPEKEGWFPENITSGIDTIILGMHARADNPELLRAKQLGLKIVSFPEFIYEQTKDKLRIVVGGSHGKTTTTAMIMHVLHYNGIKFDYLVGSAIDGYETMVGLSEDSKIAVIEGDEYLTSPLDPRPKFHLYKPHIAIINGIAWDHANVFPTFEFYCEQFRIFTSCIEPNGTLLYFRDDEEIMKIISNCRSDIKCIPYSVHGYFSNKAGCFAATISRTVKVNFFGGHNMQNMSAAKEACLAAGLDEDAFYNAIPSFPGTAKRLQKLAASDTRVVYLDFAHAPSKVKATVEAVREQYPNKKLIAILELHTYSSLNSDFMPHYRGTLDKADIAMVYFNPHAVNIKKLPSLSNTDIIRTFENKKLLVFSDTVRLIDEIKSIEEKEATFLFMSSGNFNNTNINELADMIVKQ
jgi:UDP-N-acetylmuramate: L-alanyl-gamma-D-glutamyl-meso-diaminopimelate ligase